MYNVHACTGQTAVGCNSANLRINHVFIGLSGLIVTQKNFLLATLLFFSKEPSNIPFSDPKFMLS